MFYQITGVLLACLFAADAQTIANKTQIALSINEGYPLFKTENVSNRQSNCVCQSNIALINSTWSNWAECHGQVRIFECHRGVQFRDRACHERTDCVQRVWRYCYHEPTCTGTWVEWVDHNSNCSLRTGVRVKTYICTKDKKIDMVCSGNYRAPYKTVIEPCNVQPSDGLNNNDDSLEPNLLESNSLEPNLSTWIAAGVGGVLVLFSVTLLVCISRCREANLGRSRFDQSKGGNQKDSSLKSSKKSSLLIKVETPKEKNKSMEKEMEEFPEPPPILRHSFFDNDPVPSKNQVYSLPTNKEADLPLKNNPNLVVKKNVQACPVFHTDMTSRPSNQHQLTSKNDQYMEALSTSDDKESYINFTEGAKRITGGTRPVQNNHYQSQQRDSHVYAEIFSKPTQPHINHVDGLMAASAAIKM